MPAQSMVLEGSLSTYEMQSLFHDRKIVSYRLRILVTNKKEIW